MNIGKSLCLDVLTEPADDHAASSSSKEMWKVLDRDLVLWKNTLLINTRTETRQPLRQQAMDRLVTLFHGLHEKLLCSLLHTALSALTTQIDEGYDVKVFDELSSWWMIIEAVSKHHPSVAFSSNQLQETKKVNKNKFAIVRCIDKPQYGCLLEPLLSSLVAETPDLEAKFQELQRLKIYPKGVVRAAIQSVNVDAIAFIAKRCPNLALHPLVHEVMVSRDNDDDAASMLEIARHLATVPSFLTADLFEGAIDHNDAELIKLYYSPDWFKSDSCHLVRKLIKCDLDVLLDADLLDLKNFEQICRGLQGAGALLHLAVRARRKKLVELLATTTTEIENNSKTDDSPFGHYPLWYNNHSEQWLRRSHTTSVDEATLQMDKNQIRDVIVRQMIRTCEPSKIDEIIADAEDTIFEYSFDLADLDTSQHEISDLINALRHDFDPNENLHKTLQFESILKYVEFPKIPSRPDDALVVHDEVRRVTDWLRERKHPVNEIIELIVPDRLWGAHSEETIAYITGKFGVSKLNWRCQDLSFHHLSKPTVRHVDSDTKVETVPIEQITELYLYSSGRTAVHEYWFGQQGLIKFPKLEYVWIYVIEDVLPSKYVVQSKEELQQLADDFPARHQTEHGSAIRVAVRVREYLWQAHPRNEQGENIQKITSLAFPGLHQFLEKFRALCLSNRGRKKIRVAILDNGIMAMRNKAQLHANPLNGEPDGSSIANNKSRRGILHQLKDGESFAHRLTKRKSPWFIAANPHGTQMATLICALDPSCEILVAKVGTWSADIRSEAVTKGVEWAILQNVDIISMSFTFNDPCRNLQPALQKAKAANIICFASFHDEGPNRPQAYPTDFEETISIAASNSIGIPLFTTNDLKNKFRYSLNGLDVFVGRVAHLKSDERITGSSVATATAAGLASLILSCLDISGIDYDDKKTITDWKQKTVEAFFHVMLAQPSERFIQLDKFCDLFSRKSDDPYQIDALVRKWFKDHWEQISGRIR